MTVVTSSWPAIRQMNQSRPFGVASWHKGPFRSGKGRRRPKIKSATDMQVAIRETIFKVSAAFNTTNWFCDKWSMTPKVNGYE